MKDKNLGHKLKIVYSGDTEPCQNLINYAKNSTLLIHEATMTDQWVREAKLGHHCTTSQTLDVIEKTNAWRSITTHFSKV